MCLAPYSIPNPNYGYKGKFAALKDTVSQYINIPCGHCKQCIAHKQMEIVQRVQMETLSNWVFFSTMTYNNESLPTIETSSGFKLRYSCVSDFQNMVYRIKTHNSFSRPLRWFCVSERGSKRNRPHFHTLWFVPKCESDDLYTCLNLEKELFDVVLFEWRRNYGSKRVPIYRPLCTYICRVINGELKTTYDLHFVRPNFGNGYCDVAFYVLKYMLKASKYEDKLHSALMLNYDPNEAIPLWKTVKSRSMVSKGFGNPSDPEVVKYLSNCVQRSKGVKPYPLFFNPETGQSFPLADYYKSFPQIYNMDDALFFASQKCDLETVDEHNLQAASDFYSLSLKTSQTFSKGDSLYFDELLNV